MREVWGLLNWNINGGRAIAAVKNLRVRPAVLVMQEASSDWTTSDGHFMARATMEGRMKGCVTGLRKDVVKQKRLDVGRAELNLVAVDIEANGAKMRRGCVSIHPRGKLYDLERATEALDLMITGDF